MKTRLAAGALVLALISSSFASQDNVFIPTVGTYSGLQAANYMNGGLDALLTCNKGSTEPTNALGGVPKAGQCWLDDSSATMLVKKRYSGSGWVTEAVIDVSNGLWVPPIGGGIASVSSASTTDLCASPQSYLNITGTTTITSFGSSCRVGVMKAIVFADALTLTNSASLANPSDANITTATGGRAIVAYLGSGNWIVLGYTKKDGTPLVANTVTAQALQTSARALVPVNFGLSASVASNLLTISLTAADGTTPSASNPVLLPFRDSTITSGAPVWISVTSALSISTFATGATLGATNGNAFRIWVVVFNNSGTPVIGLVNCSTPTQVYSAISNEGALATSVSISGSATSPGVIYTPNGTTVTTKAFKILGYADFESGLTTAGTYNVAPSTVHLFGPGVKKPGEVVQTVAPTLANPLTVVTFTNTATATNVTASITPSSKINLVKYMLSTTGSNNTTSGAVFGQVRRESTAIGNRLVTPITGGTTLSGSMTFIGIDGPQRSTATSYAVQGVNNSTGTGSIPAVNTDSGAVVLEEIMGANDNVPGVPQLPAVA